MALSILKNLKKAQAVLKAPLERPCLVWGASLSMEEILAEWTLQGRPYERLLTEQQIHFSAFTKWLRPIRGETNFQEAEEQALVCEKGPFQALFYKDGKFREFGGRSKAFPLREGEDAFLSPSWSYSLTGLESLANDGKLVQIKKIKFLDDQAQWRVELENADVYLTPEIIFTGRAQELVKIWDEFPCQLQSASSLSEERKIFLVRWHSPVQICELQETLFIPQSLTHEWGHFIGEFAPFIPGLGQEMTFFFFVEEEELEAEEVTRKFQNLKRTLARIFPHAEKAFSAEASISSLTEMMMLVEDFSKGNLSYKWIDSVYLF